MVSPTYVPVVQNGVPLTPSELHVTGDVDIDGYTVMEGAQTNGDFAVLGTLTASGLRVPGGMFYPQDHGLEAWTHDPFGAASSAAAVSGTLYLVKLMIRRAVTVDTLAWVVSTPAVTPTAGQNSVGLYSSAGTRLVSANVDASTTSSGSKLTAIGATALTPGFVWAAFLFNAATPPVLLRGSSFESSPSINLPNSAGRAVVNGAGLTALPASVTPASGTTAGCLTFWAGVAE